jgi:hypothetical protein
MELKRMAMSYQNATATMAEPKTTDVFLGGGAATILTLRGWCKDIRDLFSGKRFSCFSLLNVKTSLRLILLKPSSIPNSTVGEDVAIWLDKALDLANGQAILGENKVIIIRISDFECERQVMPTLSVLGDYY